MQVSSEDALSGFSNFVGFGVPRKTRRKANDFIGSTPKPDRITADHK
jgi:hypothetical protein